MMASIASMPSRPKKPRPAERNMGLEPFQILAKRLHEIRDYFHAKLQSLSPSSNVEIEAKLGLIVDTQTDGRTGPFTPGAGAIEILPDAMKGKRFVSGVTKRDFESYQTVQQKLPACQHAKMVTHAYTYPNERRVQTDADKKVIMEQKTRELEFQIHLPSCPYDCRITASVERPLDASEQPQVTDDWLSHRLKKRDSYTDGREGHKCSKWQADLTSVMTSQGSADMGASGGRQHATEQTFEVELELKAEDCKGWIELTDEEGARKRTSEIAQDLWQRMTSMMPREETGGALTPISDVELEVAGQNALIEAAASGKGRAGRDFPGTMPVGFSRRHVDKVQSETYFVGERFA
jgi:hypothetical protein